jgi:hypothetical protein
LDAAVLSAIQRSAPFAPLPESYVGEEVNYPTLTASQYREGF